MNELSPDSVFVISFRTSLFGLHNFLTFLPNLSTAASLITSLSTVWSASFWFLTLCLNTCFVYELCFLKLPHIDSTLASDSSCIILRLPWTQQRFLSFKQLSCIQLKYCWCTRNSQLWSANKFLIHYIRMLPPMPKPESLVEQCNSFTHQVLFVRFMNHS